MWNFFKLLNIHGGQWPGFFQAPCANRQTQTYTEMHVCKVNKHVKISRSITACYIHWKILDAITENGDWIKCGNICLDTLITTSTRVGVSSIAISSSVCLSVCPSALEIYTAELIEFSIHVACDCGLVFPWQSCDTLMHFWFCGWHIMFSHNRP